MVPSENWVPCWFIWTVLQSSWWNACPTIMKTLVPFPILYKWGWMQTPVTLIFGSRGRKVRSHLQLNSELETSLVLSDPPSSPLSSLSLIWKLTRCIHVGFVWVMCCTGFYIMVKKHRSNQFKPLCWGKPKPTGLVCEKESFSFSPLFFTVLKLTFPPCHISSSESSHSLCLQSYRPKYQSFSGGTAHMDTAVPEGWAQKAVRPSGFAQPLNFLSKFLSCRLLFLGSGSILTAVVKTTAVASPWLAAAWRPGVVVKDL